MAKAINTKKYKIKQLQIRSHSKFLSLCQTLDAGERPAVFLTQRVKHTGIRDIFSCLIDKSAGLRL